MRKLTDDALMTLAAVFGPEKLVDEMVKAGATNDDLARISTLQVIYSIAKIVKHKWQGKFPYQPSSMEAETYLDAYKQHLMKNLFAHSIKLETKDEHEG